MFANNLLLQNKCLHILIDVDNKHVQNVKHYN